MTKLEQAREVYIQAGVKVDQERVKCGQSWVDYLKARSDYNQDRKDLSLKGIQDRDNIEQLWKKYSKNINNFTKINNKLRWTRDKLLKLEIKTILATRKNI